MIEGYRDDNYGDPYQQPEQPAAPARRTDPVTDPNDPRLSDPAYASDPQVLAFLNGIYGPNGTALNRPADTPGWDPQQQAWQPAAGAAPGNDGGQGSTGAPQGTLTGLLAPYQGSFTAPTPTAYPTAPGFQAPTYTPPPAFKGPSSDEVLNDPGYKFAADEGERSLTQGAAAKGLLNTGGTLKDILAWGQNYAAQRYGDVYNRNLGTYNTNYQTQFLDPYKFAYQGALDTFNPKQSQWNTQMAATQRGNENDYANAYNLFNFDYNKFRDQRDSTFNKTFQYVTA